MLLLFLLASTANVLVSTHSLPTACCSDLTETSCQDACRAASLEVQHSEPSTSCHLSGLSECVRRNKALRCCDLATTQQCQNQCVYEVTKALSGNTTVKSSPLIEKCGSPFQRQNKGVWRCLSYIPKPQTASAVTVKPRVTDSDFLGYCCTKQAGETCKSECRKALYQSRTNSEPTALLTFLSACKNTEVEVCYNNMVHACQPGCVLPEHDFCHSFVVNSPFYSYRQCDSTATEQARRYYEKAVQGAPIFGILFSQNVSQCLSDTWQRFLCANMLGACSPTPESAVCLSDCSFLLRSCGADIAPDNIDAFCREHMTSASESQEDCSSILIPFQKPPPVYNPCAKSPCAQNSMCIALPLKQSSSPAYRCTPGCSLEGRSVPFIPIDTPVLINATTECTCSTQESLHDSSARMQVMSESDCQTVSGVSEATGIFTVPDPVSAALCDNQTTSCTSPHIFPATGCKTCVPFFSATLTISKDSSRLLSVIQALLRSTHCEPLLHTLDEQVFIAFQPFYEGADMTDEIVRHCTFEAFRLYHTLQYSIYSLHAVNLTLHTTVILRSEPVHSLLRANMHSSNVFPKLVLAFIIGAVALCVVVIMRSKCAFRRSSRSSTGTPQTTETQLTADIEFV